MAVSVITYIVLVAFATSHFVLGHDVSKNNNCKKVLRQVPTAAAAHKGRELENSQTNVGYQVCTRVSCTPGDPQSKCCPAEYPLCLPQGCCPEDYPKICGKYCCEEESFCCSDEYCCKNEDACCGKEKCCLEQSPCCKQEDMSACCDKDSMGCCEGYGCVPPCPSQFDAIGCQLSSLSIDSETEKESLFTGGFCKFGKVLYRILRPDENPKLGIVAKNPLANKSVLSHVNCGGRLKYASQYISTTTSLEVARYYKIMGEQKGWTGLRIALIHLDKLPEGCKLKIVDLTTEENRNKYLGKAVCKNFAKASCEVLLECNVPIPCEVIDPPPKDDGSIKAARRELEAEHSLNKKGETERSLSFFLLSFFKFKIQCNQKKPK